MTDELSRFPKPATIYTTEPISSIVSSTATANVTVTGPVLDFKRDVVRPPEDHKIYSFVGRIASEWAHVEHLFDEVIWKLAGIEPKGGACITAQMLGVYPRCKTIVAQLTMLKESTGKDTSALITKTNELMHKSSDPSDRRNRVVHDPWYIYRGSEQTAQFKSMPQRDLRFGIHPVDLSELETALDITKKYAERVVRLKDDIFSIL